METKIELNTGSGQNSFTTKKVTGFLDSILVDTPHKIEIIVESDLGYIVFKRSDHEGIRYYPVRIEGVPHKTDKNAGLFHAHGERFSLNEKLSIIVRGRNDQKVQIILRTSNK